MVKVEGGGVRAAVCGFGWRRERKKRRGQEEFVGAPSLGRGRALGQPARASTGEEEPEQTVESDKLTRRWGCCWEDEEAATPLLCAL